MDLMLSIHDGQWWDDFGAGLAALDFNGDGYDDLAVLQKGWVPDSLAPSPEVKYGKILLYYGGPGFDSTADFIIEGTYNHQFYSGGEDADLVALGDINGDGYEDLGAKGLTDYSGGTIFDARYYIAVYFGGQQPSTQPGYYKAFPNLPQYKIRIEPLDDINNDGYDDFNFVYLSNYDTERFVFVLGGSMTEVIWRQFNNVDSLGFDGNATINPVGDVNNDGYDDFVSYIACNGRINTLYFGSANIIPADSLVLFSSPETHLVASAKGLGDLNGDGIDDFTGVMTYLDICVWYGNNNLSIQHDFTLTPVWSGIGDFDHGLVHGDLNGDGFEDVIGSAPDANGYNGGFRIWLGGANMNGTSDLTKAGVNTGMHLGIGMAVGDFNGDGLCDVAASAPHDNTFSSAWGQVFVYSGNTELADTTVSSEDNTTPVTQDNWSFTIIPNPVKSRQNWKLRFTGKGYDKYNDLSVKIFNLKGQLKQTIRLTSGQVRTGEVSLKTLSLPYGIYEVSLFQNGNILKTKKVTLK